MGAETETDGQGDAMKQKWHKLYGNYSTYYVSGAIALMYALIIALNIWIYRECDVVSEKIALMLVLDIPGVYFSYFGKQAAGIQPILNALQL